MGEEIFIIALIVAVLNGFNGSDNAPVYGSKCGRGEVRRGAIVSAGNKVIRPASCIPKVEEKREKESKKGGSE